MSKKKSFNYFNSTYQTIKKKKFEDKKLPNACRWVTSWQSDKPRVRSCPRGCARPIRSRK